MFRYEKDMIPVLKEQLSELYRTEYLIEEFSSGLGIADLVFTMDRIDFRHSLNDFESMFYITNYFSSIGSVIKPNEIIPKHNLNRSKFLKVLNHLLDLDCIVGDVTGHFKIRNQYTPCLQNLFSIEAKLKDWKQGFYQALRYKQYSNKSFLAISYEYLHRVDKKLLKNNNIGLISVYPTKIQMVLNPIHKDPENTTAFYFLSDSFAAKCEKYELEYIA